MRIGYIATATSNRHFDIMYVTQHRLNCIVDNKNRAICCPVLYSLSD